MDPQNFWKLEEHSLGKTSFTHFPDGTAEFSPWRVRYNRRLSEAAQSPLA
jgi:hypothetical protein